MRDQLRRDLTAAIRGRDRTAVSALRSALAALENAEAVEVVSPETGPAPGPELSAGSTFAGSRLGLGAADVERRVLSSAEIVAIVRSEVDERRAAAVQYASHGHNQRAAELLAEADLLGAYLPTPDPPSSGDPA